MALNTRAPVSHLVQAISKDENETDASQTERRWQKVAVVAGGDADGDTVTAGMWQCRC